MLYEKTKAKQIISDPKILHDSVLSTIQQMARVVGATLGPGGRPVLIERDGMAPLITKDGVTVAKSIGLADSDKNIIIESAKEICINTAKEAGDGTTTAIVLANAIVQHGQKFLQENEKYNPQKMVNELKTLYSNEIVPLIKKHSKDANNEKLLQQVAKISANGDEEIAAVAVSAVMDAGDDGKVLIEEGNGPDTVIDSVDGFCITSGLKEFGSIGPIFMNDEAGQQNRMENGLIFLYDGTINDLSVPSRVQQALEGTEYYGMPIILLAHDFSDEVVDKIAKTKKGGYNIVPVKTPMSGLKNSRSILLRDVAAYTGATIMDTSNIKDLEPECFGDFDSARINTFETFLVSEPDSEAVDKRVGELKRILDDAPDEFSKMHLRAHIARLQLGISTILVGGSSALEIREKRDRTEDAVEAVRSAIAEGVVAGGCYMHQLIKNHINSLKEQKASYEILTKALDAPLNLLLTNCGELPDEVIPKIKGSKIFDAYNHDFVDAYKAGIVEPAKVCRVSIGNALSVASLLITLGGIVVVPRNASLEQQMDLQKQAFGEMMNAAGGDF